MHCSQKTFHFLSVSNGPTSILSDIVITLWKSHEIIFVGYFWKPKILARDVFETSQRRREKDIFFEICLRRLKDVTQKTFFLSCIWDVLKTLQISHLFWDHQLTICIELHQPNVNSILKCNMDMLLSRCYIYRIRNSKFW